MMRRTSPESLGAKIEYERQRVSALVDAYMKSQEDPLHGWGEAAPTAPMENPERVKAALADWATDLIQTGYDPSEFIYASMLGEFADATHAFKERFWVIGPPDATFNCAMFALDQANIDHKLRPSADSQEINRVISGSLHQINTDQFEPGDVLELTNDHEDELHVVFVAQSDDEIRFHSKLGETWAISNESLDDLKRRYHSTDVTVYRKHA